MSTTHHSLDRGPDGRLLCKYRFPEHCHRRRNTPKWWRKLHMTRPQRRLTRLRCHQLRHGAGFDGMAFPLGNHKPHEYYW